MLHYRITNTVSVLHVHTYFGYSFGSFSGRCQQWRAQELCSGGGGVQHIQLRTEDIKKGDLGGGSPLVRGSGGSCNLVQDISFHIVKFS